MTTKVLTIWHGEKETEDSTGAVISFSTNKLAKNADTYVLKNNAGEVVATVKIGNGAHVREI